MKRAIPFALALALAFNTTGALAQVESVDQVTRLAAFARVWGLLKYFHPDVASGPGDWDAKLLEGIPRVRAVTTKSELNEEIWRLIRSAGPAPRARVGAAIDRPESDPAFQWLDDRQLFESSTIEALKTIRNTDRLASNRYVKPMSNTQNPDFSGDTANVGTPAFPGTEVRLLALFRFWNMVQYFYPNRDLTDRAWLEVLPSLIPRFIAAADAQAYHLAVCELTASINDTHAVTSSQTLSAYWGPYIAPFQVRFIESQSVVTRVFERYLGGADIRPGDVVTDVNGVATADLRDRMRGYMTASNEGSLQRNLNAYILRAQAASMTLGISRSGDARRIVMTGVPVANWNSEAAALDALVPKWRMIAGNVGYVNMGRLEVSDVTAMMNEFRNTRAIVFDVRNYPNGTMYAIAERLNPEKRDFAKFTQPRYDQPGTIEWTASYKAGPSVPTSSYYRGRVLMLGDDRTQSHAEFTMMALRTAPAVTVVGTPTSGADGNVSPIQLPGGLLTYFSGLGVFYPDGRPTQRVGIVPDVVVEPTIHGIQNGVDEVLERALQLLEER
jgi:carboxyl-terminal processing protease